MSLQTWFENDWLRLHQTSQVEIGNLLGIVYRDLEDAQGKALSSDWQFGIAYNAALKLCTCLVYAEGFRPEKNLAHYRTLQALHVILGDAYRKDVAYLDACRMKRNTLEYDVAGVTTQADANELLDYVQELRDTVIDWLRDHRPDLLP